MRFFKWILYIPIIILIWAIITVGYFYFSTHNPQRGTLKLSGLQGIVVIARDDNGIPHIVASKSDADAFFALGFVHAQDRFWQMEFQRRVVQGTLSEIFGSATIKEDKFLRTFGFYHAAEAAWPSFDPATRTAVQAYTAGVNAFLAKGKLPIQFTILHYKPNPWTDIDSISWGKMMAFDLQNAWTQKINNYLITQRLGPAQVAVLDPVYPDNAPTILNAADLQKNSLLTASRTVNKVVLHPSATLNKQLEDLQNAAEKTRTKLGIRLGPGKGSNNWVIKGSRSSTGKPILANDPHLSLNAPGLWYLAELRGPHLHVTGATLPGVPGVLLGHNDRIAWGATNVNPDTQELYIEPNTTPITTTHEIIKVKGEPDIDLAIESSIHGPIISKVTDAGKITTRIALKWTALMPGDTTLQSIIKINYANNWQEFTEALKDYIVPSQNFVYADVKNNIGYYMPGLIPIRKGWNGALPVDPQNHEWKGFIPFEKLPHAYNPAQSYLASANNKAVPDNYIYPLTFRWREPPYRIERIIDLLNAKQKLSINDCQQIQLDTLSYLWRDLRPVLLNTKPLDRNSKTALDILKLWNGDANLDSNAATIFAFWFRELELMPAKQLPFVTEWTEPLFIKQQLATNGIYCRTNKTLSCAPYLSQSLQQAMNKLTTQLGNEPSAWQWENIHYANFSEVGLGTVKAINWIWNRSIATPGSDETVNAGMFDSIKFDQNIGPGYREIIDLSNLDKSLYIIAFGQNDNPFDKHHNDLMVPWRNGEYITISSKPQDWGNAKQLVLQPER